MFPSINTDRCKRPHLLAPRRATRFTQVELAAGLKIDQSNVSKVERGEH
jgi:transcriptional regulator with XRE-family HTH domain